MLWLCVCFAEGVRGPIMKDWDRKQIYTLKYNTYIAANYMVC